MDTGVAAAIVMAVAGATGWLAAGRLAGAPNMERLRRKSLVVLAAAIATVAAALAYAGTAMLSDGGAGPVWSDPGRVAIVAVPAIVVWIITLPRTWVLVRRRPQVDPLSWVGPATQARVSSGAYTVPLGSAMAAAGMVVLTPTAVIELPYGAGLAGVVAALAVATALIDSRQRRRTARDLGETAPPARMLLPAGR